MAIADCGDKVPGSVHQVFQKNGNRPRAIIVCSLSDFENVCESVKPTHAISVIDPGFEPKTPPGIKNHLKLGFDDITSINDSGPIYRMPGQNNNIQTRPIFSGNILRHPAFQNLNSKKNNINSFKNSDYIMRNGLLIGCHQGLTSREINYIHKIINKFILKKIKSKK